MNRATIAIAALLVGVLVGYGTASHLHRRLESKLQSELNDVTDMLVKEQNKQIEGCKWDEDLRVSFKEVTAAKVRIIANGDRRAGLWYELHPGDEAYLGDQAFRVITSPDKEKESRP